MIRINLLPYIEKKRKETQASSIIIIGAAFAVFFAIIAGAYLFMNMSINNLQNEVKDSETRLETLNKIVGEIDGYKEDKEVIEKKLSIIKNLEENRLYPVRMLDQLATLTPAKEIWLEKMSELGTNLDIAGIGRDGIAVARYMKILETASFISSVDLVASRQKEIAGQNLQEFNLKCVTRKKL